MKHIVTLVFAATLMMPTIAAANPDEEECTYITVDPTTWRVQCADNQRNWSNTLWWSGGDGSASPESGSASEGGEAGGGETGGGEAGGG